MTALARLKVGLIGLVWINMIPAALPGEAEEQALGILGLALIGGLAGVWRSLSRHNRKIHNWVVQLGVVGAVGYLIRETMFSPTGQTIYLLDLVHFLMLLAVCKFLELNNHRDMALLALIGFLLLIVNTFVNTSWLFGAVLTLDLLFGLGWLSAFQQHREWHQVRQRQPVFTGESMSEGEAALAPELWPATRHFMTSARHLLLMAPLALAVFVAVPREWSRGLLVSFSPTAVLAQTGFTEEIELRNRQVVPSEAPIMRVRFKKGGEVVEDAHFSPYLRGMTLDCQAEGRWVSSAPGTQKIITVRDAEGPVLLTSAARFVSPQSLIEQEFWLEEGTGPCLFAMGTPLSLQSSDIRRIKLSTADYSLRLDQRRRGGVHYTVFSTLALPAEAVLAQEKEQNQFYEQYGVSRLESSPPAPADSPGSKPLELPSTPGVRPVTPHLSPAVMNFAREFVAGLPPKPDPSEDQNAYIARKISHFLASNSFSYTLNRGDNESGKDPIEDFLLHNRRGHCEYFAVAMTALCQAVGIPARIVSGYHGGEFNSVGGFYQFRQSDAHAWVEVFIPQKGWRPYDPSPTAGTATHGPSGWRAAMRRWSDFLQFKWSNFVVMFDSAVRQKLIGGLRAWLSRLSAEYYEKQNESASILAVIGKFLWGSELLTTWQRGLYWLLLALVIVFVTLLLRVLWIVALMARAFLPRRARGIRAMVRPAEARYYDHLLRLLAQRGYIKSRHQTPREFALDLAARHHDLAAVATLTEWFYAAQYGRRQQASAEAKQVQQYLSRLQEDPSFGTS